MRLSTLESLLFIITMTTVSVSVASVFLSYAYRQLHPVTLECQEQ